MNLDVRHIRFRVRGRPAADWTTLNEILLERELGLETDTRRFKFGDGATAWNDLDYAVGTGGEPVAMRVDSGWIQYSSDGEVTWENLIELSELEGAPGADGDDGRSAYQVAVDNGFVGSEAEWLESLEGADGRSAYQVAIDNGFVGSEAEWLESLEGADGRSAYQVAVDNGFVGSEAEWLESLEGADGRSAYQVAVDNGFVGSEAEWLESLEGEPGPPGGMASRASVTFAHGTSTVAVGKSALLLSIECDVAARIRLYCTAAARTADSARAAGVAPPQGAGLLLEFITTVSFLGAPLTPGVIAHNDDTTPTGVIYANVQPDTSPTASVDLTYLPLET